MALVVVIEDDLASQKTLARVLRAGGYDAATYGSAEEFLSSRTKVGALSVDGRPALGSESDHDRVAVRFTPTTP